MKIWHHFICTQLMLIAHLTKVTREWALLLNSIKKGLTINVGHQISPNIRHAAQNVTTGIPHLTLMIELIAAVGLSTLNQEILQLTNPLKQRAIEQIMRVEGRGDGDGAGASGTGSSQQARPTKTRATVSDLARAVDEQQVEI